MQKHASGGENDGRSADARLAGGGVDLALRRDRLGTRTTGRVGVLGTVPGRRRALPAGAQPRHLGLHRARRAAPRRLPRHRAQRRHLRRRRARRRGHRRAPARARSAPALLHRRPAAEPRLHRPPGRAEGHHRRLPPARHGGHERRLRPGDGRRHRGRVDATKAACVQAGARAGDPPAALRHAHLSAGARPHRRHQPDRGAEDRARRLGAGPHRPRPVAQRRRDRRHLPGRRPSPTPTGAACDDFLGRIAAQAGCMVGFVYVQDAVTCPAPVCGNGMQERGEECDDGNDYDGDGCRSDCTKTQCEAFATTFDLIQQAIFENHGCTDNACHGNAQSGGLDLRAGVSYDSLVDVPSSIDPARQRVEPGDSERSLLFLKLAAKTLPDQYRSRRSARHADAARRPAGAQRGRARGAAHLDRRRRAAQTAWCPAPASCSTPACPSPSRSRSSRSRRRPPATASSSTCRPGSLPRAQRARGLLRQLLRRHRSGAGGVPQPRRHSSATTSVQIRQDPLSHHLIVNLYTRHLRRPTIRRGAASTAAAARRRPTCDPLDVAAAAPAMLHHRRSRQRRLHRLRPARQPVALAVPASPAPSRPTPVPPSPTGVYNELPLKGMIIWNSHAFNLTDKDGMLEAGSTSTSPAGRAALYSLNGIFDASAIFTMNVPAFQQEEVCNIYVLPRTPTSSSSARTCTSAASAGAPSAAPSPARADRRAGQAVACDPLSPSQCSDGVACAAPDARDPRTSLLYTNFIYNDPVVLRFEPPLVFTGTKAERSLTYCALYDNGFTDPAKVKRQSTSPPTPFGTSACAEPTNCTAAWSARRAAARPARNGTARATPAPAPATASATPARCAAASPPRTRCSSCWGRTSSNREPGRGRPSPWRASCWRSRRCARRAPIR